MSKRGNYLWFFPLLFLLIRLFLFLNRPSSKLSQGDRIIIRSCLDSQPRARFGQQYFWLAGVKIISRQPPTYSFGDCLRVEGVVRPGQSRRGRVFYLENPKIGAWKKPPLNKAVWLQLQKLGRWLQDRAVVVYRNWLPEPEASLVSGIVLGAKSKLPRGFYEKLRLTGTLHIVVASGYNLTVISRKPVGAAAWFVGRRLALVFGWLVVWLYVLVSGGEPPVVRAAIIISLIYLAQFLGKKFDVWRAFWLAIWLMLLVNPKLLTSISFQLSIAAMAGLLLFDKKWQGLRKIPFVGKDLAESLSAQLMVLPIIAYHFGQVSWAAPLINMFVLPLVPRLMEFGLFALLGLFWSWLAVPFLYLTYPLAWFFTWFIEQTGRHSWLTVSFRFTWWMVAAYYLVLWLIWKIFFSGSDGKNIGRQKGKQQGRMAGGVVWEKADIFARHGLI
jgi:ComEC/Rec2-related protein